MRTDPLPPGPKIRLGYIGADFHNHPVSQLLVGILERHDRDAFEVTAFSYGPYIEGDILQPRLMSAVDRFVQLPTTAEREPLQVVEAAAQAVFDHQIDILVSLNGHTAHALPEILAKRPAPVQVNFLGFPGGMGADYVDYIIADRCVIPEADRQFYAEQVVWLPHTYQPTDDRAPIAEAVPTRDDERLPQDAFVLMGYNRPHKISPPVFEVWMRLLKRLDKAVLWLQGSDPRAEENLRREAAARGVDPVRLIFAGRTDTRAEHVARTRLADLFIDTLPYNAHSITSDTLWAGVPAVTCAGGAFHSRVCASLLKAGGLPELVTESLEDYEELIVALAGDPARLAALRQRLADQRATSPLFDTARYTRNLEAAYKAMHARSLAKLPPEAIALDDVS